MYTFDSKLPKTTTYWKEEGIFFIKHTNFMLSTEEILAIGELLKEAHRDKNTTAIVINNREAKGAWTHQANQVWMEVTAEFDYNMPKKVATLTNDAIAKMQINRLTRSHGAEKMSRAFCNDYDHSVKAFFNE